MADIITVVILLCIAAGIICYLRRSKKRGDACIGCPYSRQCSGSCHKEHESRQKADMADQRECTGHCQH